METKEVIQDTGCCPKFNPEPWENKELFWQDKSFVKDHVTSFMHIPLNFPKVMIRMMDKISKADAHVPDDLILSDENSLWGSDLYFSVDKEVPDAIHEKISGKFITKVYEGPYKNSWKWVKDMISDLKTKGVSAKKVYHWYTTCPKCAKAYGKNYTVLFAQIN